MSPFYLDYLSGTCNPGQREREARPPRVGLVAARGHTSLFKHFRAAFCNQTSKQSEWEVKIIIRGNPLRPFFFLTRPVLDRHLLDFKLTCTCLPVGGDGLTMPTLALAFFLFAVVRRARTHDFSASSILPKTPHEPSNVAKLPLLKNL